MQSVELPQNLQSELKVDHTHALLVVGVEPNGPAEVAGVIIGDILVALDGKAVIESDTVQGILDPETVGKSVDLRLVRGGQEKHLSATVAERPARKHKHG